MSHQIQGDTDSAFLPLWLRAWVLAGVAVMVLWGAFSALSWHVFSLKHEWLGQWGDSFGPMTSLASTLTMVFALWSVHMQRRELELQRKETAAAREHNAMQARVDREVARQQMFTNILSLISAEADLARRIAANDRVGERAVREAANQRDTEHPMVAWQRLKAAWATRDSHGKLSDARLNALALHANVLRALYEYEDMKQLRIVLERVRDAFDHISSEWEAAFRSAPKPRE